MGPSPLLPLTQAAQLFAAICLISGYGFTQLSYEATYPALRVETFYLFFGLAVFGFEGVNLAIPIESAMANRKAYPRGTLLRSDTAVLTQTQF